MNVTLVVTHLKQLRRHQQMKLFGRVNGATNQNKQTLASSGSNNPAINSYFFVIKEDQKIHVKAPASFISKYPSRLRLQGRASPVGLSSEVWITQCLPFIWVRYGMMQGYCPLFGSIDFKHQEIIGALLAFQR